MYKIDKSDSEKKVEDSLDNVENEQFISSQQGVTIGLPLMIFVTLNILLPVFIINSFTKYIISFLMLLFFVWIIIKFYPTPDELNDKLLHELDLYKYKHIFNFFEIPVTYISKSLRFNGKKFLITKIGDRAFKGCTNFKSFNIPNSIKKIGSEAFSGCTGLITLKVPDSVTEIKANAFLGVKNVIYNGSATGSPWGAENINKIEKINLTKEGINRHQEYMQRYLLKTDFIDSKKRKYSQAILSIVFLLFIIMFTLFYISSLSAVEKNKYFLEMVIPLLGLIIYSFSAIIYEFVDKNELNNYTLKFITKKNKFEITSIDILEKYDSSLPSVQRFYYYNNTKFFITTIKKGLFKNCTNLKEVKIPDSVYKIGAEAFSGCTGIDNIEIPDYVIDIGKNAFLGVNNVIYHGSDPNAPWGAKALNGQHV